MIYFSSLIKLPFRFLSLQFMDRVTWIYEGMHRINIFDIRKLLIKYIDVKKDII